MPAQEHDEAIYEKPFPAKTLHVVHSQAVPKLLMEIDTIAKPG